MTLQSKRGNLDRARAQADSYARKAFKTEIRIGFGLGLFIVAVCWRMLIAGLIAGVAPKHWGLL
ncbi:hypothetical protein [Pseudooceanicola sp. 200-1SW]|uniref:hypothetical protein n=1 Tax=Pseudooceanicola sp. 200-1SW TaxID=3425949 RepID=UPI003D7F2D73